MTQHRMFDFVREDIKEVPTAEKWSLKQLRNPKDPDSSEISPIKVSNLTETLGELPLGHASLAIVQEHVFGMPPKHISFALQPEGIVGDALIHGKKTGNLVLLVGEIGTEEGRLFQLPMAKGVNLVVLDWIQGLAENTYW